MDKAQVREAVERALDCKAALEVASRAEGAARDLRRAAHEKYQKAANYLHNLIRDGRVICRGKLVGAAGGEVCVCDIADVSDLDPAPPAPPAPVSAGADALLAARVAAELGVPPEALSQPVTLRAHDNAVAAAENLLRAEAAESAALAADLPADVGKTQLAMKPAGKAKKGKADPTPKESEAPLG